MWVSGGWCWHRGGFVEAAEGGGGVLVNAAIQAGERRCAARGVGMLQFTGGKHRPAWLRFPDDSCCCFWNNVGGGAQVRVWDMRCNLCVCWNRCCKACEEFACRGSASRRLVVVLLLLLLLN